MDRLSRFRKPNEDGMFREPSRDRRITKLENLNGDNSHPTDPYPPLLDLLLTELPGVSRRSARVFLHGVGREGLMLKVKAFAMRLFHLGLSSHLVSDVTTPPISSPDLLTASAGPGRFSTVDVICSIAKSCGAKVVLITAQPERGSCVKQTTDVCYVPAQTWQVTAEVRRRRDE
ncbi:unnamed protein product [Brassica oleracea]